MDARYVSGADAGRDELARALPAYEIGPPIGRGAFAVVYAGRHIALGTEVAIKRLHPELLRDANVRRRFAAEARTLGLLEDEHIVRVRDYVERDDLAALVMERLHGGSVADRIALGGCAPAVACAIALSVLRALEHAHERGVLHRDVKPANLLFGDGGIVKVVDFGIAAVIGAEGARLTGTGSMIGTPVYMAPEQVRRAIGDLSPATDVWAVGAVLYELLSGAPPFAPCDDVGEMLIQRISQAPAALGPAVPRAVGEVVMRALRRDPAERFETAAACAAALEEAASRDLGPDAIARTGVPLRPARSRPSDEATLVSPAGPQTPPAASQPPWRSPRALLAGAGVIAILVAAALGAMILNGDNAPSARADAPVLVPRTLPIGGFSAGDETAGDALARMGPGAFVDVPSSAPRRRAEDAWAHGLVPWIAYYELRRLGRRGTGDIEQTEQLLPVLASPKRMRTYWKKVRELFRSLRGGREIAMVAVETSVWAKLEKYLLNYGGPPRGPPQTIKVSVQSSGLHRLKGLPDTFEGFSRAWRRLRDDLAPRVLLGWGTSDYGSGDDLSTTDGIPRARAEQQGRRAAAFYGTLGGRFDFAALEISAADAGNEAQEAYSDAEKENVLSFVRAFTRASGVPVVLQQVPMGNDVMRTIDDQEFHYEDTWVQWLMGDARLRNLRRMRDAGVIGVQLGVRGIASAGATCACDASGDGVTNDGPSQRKRATSADDDGGYVADRMRVVRRAGGVRIAARSHAALARPR